MTPSPGTIRRSVSTISVRRSSTAASGAGIFIGEFPALAKTGSALARLIPGVGLVDDVGAPLAAHDAAVLVALFQRFQRIDDLHAHVLGEGRKIGSGGAEVKSRRPKDLPTCSSRCRSEALPAAPQLGDVVADGEKGLDVARRLAQALTVLDQGDADEALAIFATTVPRRHGPVRVGPSRRRGCRSPERRAGWAPRRTSSPWVPGYAIRPGANRRSARHAGRDSARGFQRCSPGGHSKPQSQPPGSA